MSEVTPDRKPRSSFLPILLLVVVLVIVAGIVVVFVPMVECGGCVGVGTLSAQEIHGEESARVHRDLPCFWCKGTGKETAWQNVTAEYHTNFDSFVNYYGEAYLRDVLKNRKSTP